MEIEIAEIREIYFALNLLDFEIKLLFILLDEYGLRPEFLVSLDVDQSNLRPFELIAIPSPVFLGPSFFFPICEQKISQLNEFLIRE